MESDKAKKSKDGDKDNKDGKDGKDAKKEEPPFDYQLARALDLIRGIHLYEAKEAKPSDTKPSDAKPSKDTP